MIYLLILKKNKINGNLFLKKFSQHAGIVHHLRGTLLLPARLVAATLGRGVDPGWGTPILAVGVPLKLNVGVVAPAKLNPPGEGPGVAKLGVAEKLKPPDWGWAPPPVPWPPKLKPAAEGVVPKAFAVCAC